MHNDSQRLRLCRSLDNEKRLKSDLKNQKQYNMLTVKN